MQSIVLFGNPVINTVPEGGTIMNYCPIHDHDCMVTYYNSHPCYNCEQAAECEDCIALNNPTHNGKKYRFTECDFCGKKGPAPYEAVLPRPSDPTDYCCVMAACEKCGPEHGLRTFEYWDSFCEENGFFFS